MIQLFDDPLSMYLSTNTPPEMTVTAIVGLRELLSNLDDPSNAIGNIRHVTFEKGGDAGVVAITFHMDTQPRNFWKDELRYVFQDKLRCNFQRCGDYQVAIWTEGITIAIT